MSVGSIASSDSSYWEDLFSSVGKQNSQKGGSLASGVFSQLESDGNEGLSLAESGLNQEKFDQLDTDGDGVISMDELEKSLELQRSALPTLMKLEGQDLLAALANSSQSTETRAAVLQSGGGGSSTSLLDELEESEEEGESSASTVYDPLDVDQDGSVSASELNAYLDKAQQSSGSGQQGMRNILSSLARNAYNAQSMGYGAYGAGSESLSMTA